MAASAQLLTVLTSLPHQAAAERLPTSPEGTETMDLSHTCDPDSTLDGSASCGTLEPPLTSEPPLADSAPLTSEPPLAAPTPLTSESTGDPGELTDPTAVR